LNVTVTVETIVAARESRLGRGGGAALTPAPG
jgi:hypothetical protein